MSLRPEELRIVLYPDPVLRQKAAPIDQIDDQVRSIAARMLELMHAEDGIGLAAPQVGLSWRLFVTRGDDETGQPADRVFINPTISILDRTLDSHEEGCLSLPDIRGQIRRPVAVRISAQDEHGRPFQLESDDFLARVWQHEFDHLNGTLIIDKFTPLDRLAHRRAIKQLETSSRIEP